jgi:EAL domain-containing protein (putative c-di-GMP-specific phosphodiesterase class I)
LAALTDSNDAAAVAEKTSAALDQPFNVEGHELHINGSIGISLYPTDGSDVQTLMRAADTAMYHAKQQGRGNYQFFTSSLNEAAQRRLTVANQLQQALAQGDFSVYYQPQVNMQSGRIFSAEALLRLNVPNNPPMSCSEFISVAEETGLIVPIGEWVLRQACAQIKYWRNQGHPNMRIAVNLSARQFFQHGLSELIYEILKELDLPADALELEITESMLMQPSRNNMTILRQLSAMGVQLSIDDFGTGYSSLAYLQQFPIHALKIDRSFVKGISKDTHDSAIVVTIITMAQSMHLRLIAEGVDSAEQVTFLKAHGCLAAQGFYYNKPVPAEEFTELLKETNYSDYRLEIAN